MQPQILVVSDPPHGDVDYEAVARMLGLEPSDVKLKAAFPAPEILAASDRVRAEALGRSLAQEGLSIRVLDGYELAGVPWAELASDVAFGDRALSATLSGGRLVELPYGLPLFGVFLEPPPELDRVPESPRGDLGTVEGPALADALEWSTHLDLYYGEGGETRRIVVADGAAELVGTIEERFVDVDVDRRLQNVRPRQRFVAGEAGFDLDLRKAFSFGTLLLRQVMESISPDLRDIPQYEFASRLSYVMRSLSKRS